MNRFHVHLAVSDLSQSIDFYTKLFGEGPTKVKDDYAKWALEDPRINFAISSGRQTAGLNHFGIQAETADDLGVLESRVESLDSFSEEQVECCYARGNKHWVVDPQGIPWEHFHTLADVEVYGGSDVALDTGVQSPGRGPESTVSCCG